MCLAIPAKIKKIQGTTACVDFGGVVKTVSLGILDGVKEGDFVLIHAGFAIGKVSPREAADTLRAIRELKDVTRGFE